MEGEDEVKGQYHDLKLSQCSQQAQQPNRRHQRALNSFWVYVRLLTRYTIFSKAGIHVHHMPTP